jgi:hypothetical protein
MDTIATRVAELVAEGNSTSIIRAHLTIEGHKAKAIGEALTEAGLVGKRASFRTVFWDYLVESRPTVAEAESFIDEWIEENPEKNSNIIRHRGTFVNEAKLAERIRGAIES